MASSTRPVRQRLHYGWIVAALTFLTLLAAAGVRSTPGVLIVPLEREFGWDRAGISLAVSLNLLLYGFMGPFSAALADRLGPRRLMAIAMTVLAVGVSLTSLMNATWQLVLLWGLVIGGSSGMVALALGAFIVSRWFSERRGLVMGLISASTATGQLLFLPLLASLIEHYGWRAAVLTVAGIALVMAPVLGLFMRDRPSDLGLRSYGQKTDVPEPLRATGNPITAAFAALGEAVRSRDFWLLSMSFFVCGLSTNGLIGTHLIAACVDKGIPEVQAASLLALMGLCDIVGTTGSGWLSDRFNNRYLLCGYYGLRGLSLLFLPLALDGATTIGAGLTAFGIFYGLDWLATVPPTVRLTADIFGRERAGMVYGWIVALHQVGSATAALAAGIMRTYLGDYFDAFLLSGIACLVAAILVLRIGKASRRDRQPQTVEEAPAVA